MDDKNFSIVANFTLSAYNLVRKVQKQIDEKYNITANNLFYVLTVVSNEGMNQEAIGDLLWVNKSKVARTLNALEEADVIVRKQDKNNRRQNNIYTTEKGKKIYRDTMIAYQELLSESNDTQNLKESILAFMTASLNSDK